MIVCISYLPVGAYEHREIPVDAIAIARGLVGACEGRVLVAFTHGNVPF